MEHTNRNCNSNMSWNNLGEIVCFFDTSIESLSNVVGQILLVIKAYLDSFFAMMSFFIHQFDHEYNFLSSSVGSSINELFSNMRQLFYNSPRFFKPASP